MHVNDAVEAVQNLQATLGERVGMLAFNFERHSSNGTFREIFRQEVPAPGVSEKCGVYFFTTASEEILYIGKATNKNLGAEIYSKFKTAQIVDVAADIPRFQKSDMAAWAPTPELKELLFSGDVHLVALAIEPPALSSLVEVYLQTLCLLGKDGRLPALNRQIG